MAKALQLGRYHLLDRIAFGGMAEIYRAKTFDDEGRVHMVAVKRILSHLARDPEFIKMLVDEAKIASLMQHEAIARVFEFCYAHGEYFIAMEYVDGKDCRTLLDRCRAQRRWVPPEICAFIMMHIMRGLHRAHRQTDTKGRALNLIHRDISPSNVICSYAGEVKLCDFGIAKATLSTVQTRSGVIKGKVKYMSPEQAMGRRLDPRTDIFSGGSVLYEMLTRVPPFLAPNEMELLVLVRETRYTPVRTRNPMVPPALEVIVDTAMAKKRHERYQTADQFADALEEYLNVHAPKLTRSHLGRFVRQLFADDIEKELRALEEYVVVSADDEEVGVNLIADALGPDADFSKFSPNPTSGVTAEEEQPPRAGETEANDMDDSRVADPALRDQPTVILDADAAADVEDVPSRPAPVAEVLWQKSGAFAPAPAGPAPGGPLPGGEQPRDQIHDAATQILDLGEEESRPSQADEDEESTMPGLPPERIAARRRSAQDTAEVPTHAPAPGDGALAGEVSHGDHPDGIHDMPTGQLEQTPAGMTPLTDANTEQLEVSDLVSVVDASEGASAPGGRAPVPFGGDGPAPSTEETPLAETLATDPEAEPDDESDTVLGEPSPFGGDRPVRSGTQPGIGVAPVRSPSFHSDSTQLLEVDDLEPEPDADGSEPERTAE